MATQPVKAFCVLEFHSTKSVITVQRMIQIRNAYKILVGKPEETRLLGKSSHRFKENVRMDLK
jgi:hypothetical protein